MARYTSNQQQCDQRPHSNMISKVHLPFLNQRSHFIPQPASSISSFTSLSSFDLQPQNQLRVARYTSNQQQCDLRPHFNMISKVHLPFLNQPSHFIPQPASSISSFTSLSSFDLQPQNQLRVARYTSNQQQCDLRPHNNMISKVHLPFLNQPSHFIPQPASSMSSFTSLSSFDLQPQNQLPFL